VYSEFASSCVSERLHRGRLIFALRMSSGNVFSQIPTDRKDFTCKQYHHPINQMNGQVSKVPRTLSLAVDKKHVAQYQGPPHLASKTQDVKTHKAYTHTKRDEANRSFLRLFTKDRHAAFLGEIALDGRSDLCPENRARLSYLGLICLPHQFKGMTE
jgi:hypothetical protein